MNVLKDADISIKPILERTVAIVGYGNQAKAQALNLRDSGVKVIIALRSGSASHALAVADGFTVADIASAAKQADLTMLLAPDEVHGKIYDEHLHENLKPNSAIGFSHGFSIRFNLLKPRDDLDVIMVAPKGPGKTLRELYEKGLGMPCLYGVAQDRRGNGAELAIAYAGAIGGGRAGILASSFAEECETDLFSEQAILCGGIPALIKAGFETLVDAGYAPEVAYIECLHEVKQIADLLWEGGLEHMDKAISNTAEFGGYTAGQRIVSADVRAEMQAILADVQSGKFAKSFLDDVENGGKIIKQERAKDAAHPIEPAGDKVRVMLPWLKS
ncbi:MAG: ketol-acid reductoisomerase [Sphingomonadales bacterium]|nr:ketol-acid reductoisomerase [Sphingomonadales bacterium]